MRQGRVEIAHDSGDGGFFIVAGDEDGDARTQGATLLNTYSFAPR